MKDSFSLEPINNRQPQPKRFQTVSPLYLWAVFSRHGLNPDKAEDIARLVNIIFLLQWNDVEHGYQFKLNIDGGFYFCPELEFEMQAAIQECRGIKKIATCLSDGGFDDEGYLIKNPNYICQ